eukprot:gene4429-2161_t
MAEAMSLPAPSDSEFARACRALGKATGPGAGRLGAAQLRE